MPTETWQNILSQAHQVLQELADTGATTRTTDELVTLALHVDLIYRDEYVRVNALGRSPRVVQWDEDYFNE
ncbi:MAG: hypothetical protein OXN21_02710 [Chloroflexota bacterium]|nr:hypothetical protein [Chloroflexota bacterium]